MTRLRPTRADGTPLPAAQLHAERPFEWREDSKTVVHEAHALRTLKREARTRSVADMTRDIPADKLEKLGEILASLIEGTPE